MINKFKSLLSVKTAIKGFITISLIAFFYHFLILTGLVDYKNAWGGQLETKQQMYVFESISILIQSIFFGLVLLFQRMHKQSRVNKAIKYVFFVISLIFALNTVGNIFAVQLFERVVFTPLTLLAAAFAFRVAVE